MTDQNHLDELLNIGVGVNHINGSLIDHLQGTHLLLHSWGASDELCRAGLYHALYGTSGFDNHLISHYERSKAQAILGVNAEQIIYTYCACDRDFFWPQIGIKSSPIFLNRFTKQQYQLTLEELQQFCELTVANELEIARDNKDFIKKYGESLNKLFDRMKPFISRQASSYQEEIFNMHVVT